MDAKFILDGYSPEGIRYDAVQTAMVALDIPPVSNGRNNARILRYHLRRMDEETFRQIVYQQWRENAIDGLPRNVAAALTAKLFDAEGGAA